MGVRPHTHTAHASDDILRKRQHLPAEAAAPVSVGHRHAVRGPIAALREPSALKGIVIRLRRKIDADAPGGLPLAGKKPAVALSDVPPEHVWVRKAVLPLGHALFPQESAGLSGNAHERADVVLLRFAAVENRLFPFGEPPNDLFLLPRPGPERGEHIGPPLPGADKLLLPPPRGHVLMVPGEQHLRRPHALPDLRPGILRVLQKPVPVALPHVALGVGQHARHHAAHAVGYGHGGYLPAGQDKVAKAQLLIAAQLDEPLVHALIMAADEDEMVVFPRQPPGLRLVKRRPLRGHIDDPPTAGAGLRGHMIEARLQRLSHHDAAPAAAIGIVVHLLLFICGKVPYLDAVNLYDALGRRPAQDGRRHHGVHRVREQCENIDTHHFYLK